MEPSTMKPEKTSNSAMMIAVFALLAGLVALGLLIGGVFSDSDELRAEIADLQGKLDTFEQQQGYSVNEEVNQDTYQAVFLADGTVYFGKLSDGLPGQVKLENIYYLQGADYSQGGEISGNGQISLAKLGDEIHGPEDVMHISRDQVTFWENMKLDSQVMQAITAYITAQ